MDYNIPLIRRVYKRVTSDPASLDQSRWPHCIAGHTIREHGEYALVRDTRPHVDGSEVIDMRTGERFDTVDVAGALLGMDPTQAKGLFESGNRLAVDWLGDILAAHDTAVLDRYAAELAA